MDKATGTKEIVIDNPDCPEWVQKAGKCEPFKLVVDSAKKYQAILKADWKIDAAEYKNKHIFIELSRGTLKGKVDVGEFKNVKELYIDSEGRLVVDYYTQAELNAVSKAKWFGGGVGAGTLFWLVIIAVIFL